MPTDPTLPGIAAALDQLLEANAKAAATNPAAPIPPTMTLAAAEAYAKANNYQFRASSAAIGPDGNISIKGAFVINLAGMGDSIVGTTSIVSG